MTIKTTLMAAAAFSAAGAAFPTGAVNLPAADRGVAGAPEAAPAGAGALSLERPITAGQQVLTQEVWPLTAARPFPAAPIFAEPFTPPTLAGIGDRARYDIAIAQSNLLNLLNRSAGNATQT